MSKGKRIILNIDGKRIVLDEPEVAGWEFLEFRDPVNGESYGFKFDNTGWRIKRAGFDHSYAPRWIATRVEPKPASEPTRVHVEPDAQNAKERHDMKSSIGRLIARVDRLEKRVEKPEYGKDRKEMAEAGLLLAGMEYTNGSMSFEDYTKERDRWTSLYRGE